MFHMDHWRSTDELTGTITYVSLAQEHIMAFSNCERKKRKHIFSDIHCKYYTPPYIAAWDLHEIIKTQKQNKIKNPKTTNNYKIQKQIL